MANTQKTVIVTGGSRGIGAGLVKAFLDRGYQVVANSQNITEVSLAPRPRRQAET
jgi:NAD(P)-dependent dehydrogenase (short-subunit alcohol dehydrogenase family)